MKRAVMTMIKFNEAMFPAVVDGRKTQTRRPVDEETEELIRYHAGEPGEEVEVSFIYGQSRDDDGAISEAQWLVYASEYPEEGVIELGQCPYGSAGDRLRAVCSERSVEIEVVAVRLERLQDISEQDAKAEGLRWHGIYQEWGGVEPHPASSPDCPQWRWYETPETAFQNLWQSIYGLESWETSKWVWVIEFERVEA